MAGNENVSVIDSGRHSSDRQTSNFICRVEDCGKEFRRRDRLLIHLRTHTGERPFICEEPGCNKSYCRHTHLLRHQQNAHGPLREQKKAIFQCEEDGCSREFTLAHNLQKHIRRQHSTEALHKYKCEVEGCQETFRKHHQLRTHSYTHTSINPYRCSHPGCLRTFQTTTRLRRHNKVHQGYKCDKEGCNLSFNKWTELRQHWSKDHLEEYACEKCSKTFPKRHLLNNHHRSHHEEKTPLSCPYDDCGRVYWDKRNMKAHIRRYHEEERFLCDQPDCEKSFASKQRLNEHMKTHNLDYVPPVRTCKDQAKQAKKPGRKKKSIASKLSGICDMEIQHDLEPITLVNKDLECTKTQNKQPVSKDWEDCNTAQQCASQSETVIMQTDWGNVLKLHTLPAPCVSLSNSGTPTADCLTAGERAGDESVGVDSGTDGAGSCVSDHRSNVYASQSQKIITAPPSLLDSDMQCDSSSCVTLAAL